MQRGLPIPEGGEPCSLCGPPLVELGEGGLRGTFRNLKPKTLLAWSQFCTFILECPSTDSSPQLLHDQLPLSLAVTFSSGIPCVLMSFLCFPWLCPISQPAFHPAAPAAALASPVPSVPVLQPWPCFPSCPPKPSVPPPGLSPALALLLLLWIPMREGII